jgi:hypothetical protein
MLDLPLTLTDTVLKPARIVTITRADGEIIRIAEAQTAITISGDTWSPLAGFVLSAGKWTVGGEAASMQIDAAMSVGGTFDLYEVVDGKFDNAEVRVDIVNRASPTTRGFLFLGHIEPVTFGALRNSVTFDVRGQVARAGWPFAWVFGPMCRTDLGSDLCRVPLRPSPVARGTAYTTTQFGTSVDQIYVRVSSDGSGHPEKWESVYFECTTAGTTHASVQPSYTFTLGVTTTDGTAVFTCRSAWTRYAKVGTIYNQFNFALDRVPDVRAVDGWYNGGAVRMFNGYSAGRAFEIGAWTATGVLVTLYLPLGAANNQTLIAEGDDLEIWPGCDFTIDMCSGRYNNAINFRGEPYFAGAITAGITVPAPTPPASSWTPADISTLLWLDASDAATVTLSGSDVTQWDDKSGNGNHVTQSTSGNRPDYDTTTNIVNGLNVITFDGSDDFLAKATLGGFPANVSTAITAVCVVQYRGATAVDRAVFDISDGALTNRTALQFITTNNSLNTTTVVARSGDLNSAATTDSPDTGSAGDMPVFCTGSLHQTSKRQAWLNGSTDGPETSGGASYTYTNLRVGRLFQDVFPWGVGEICEIVIFQGEDDTTRQLLEGYMMWKWGIESLLPGGHPYAASPP